LANVLDGLVSRIDDPTLRADIAHEITLLRDTKEFGLVFERHLPEQVWLNGYPVQPGCRVVDRALVKSPNWVVKSVRNGLASLVADDGSEERRPVDKLAVVKDFGDAIYPGLRRVERIERGGEKPFHIVVNAENYHALQTLLYPYEGKIDSIYIDPPYNTGARDWKYNNDYVDSNDSFRHSKWLSFMEKRLLLAKRLLRPEDSVLLVTIDDNEVYSLGLLLDQIFRGCERQMVSITISPRGKSRVGRLSQVDEYLIVVYLGAAAVADRAAEGDDVEVRWRYLRREDVESARGTKKGGPRQFYPIYVDPNTQRIVAIGEPLAPNAPLEAAPPIVGAVAVFPIREDGKHMNWGLTGPSLKRKLEEGYVRVGRGSHAAQPFTVSYLTDPNIKKVEAGNLRISGTRSDGSKIVIVPGGRATRITTAWRESRHDAGAHGTGILGQLIPDRKFPFPKSLYAVEDTLRVFLQEKPDALVLDFFAGSGTTAHAVFRLNREDGGRRCSISITNNEVSDAEAQQLRAAGHSPGDPQWEALGIFRHVALPRIKAAVTGRTPAGKPIEGQYQFGQEFPISDGFAENVEFFDLEYLDPNTVSRGQAFEAIAPLLWLQAGGIGRSIDRVVPCYSVGDPVGTYAVLFEIGRWQDFADELDKRPAITHAFIVTDSLAAYQEVLKALPAELVVSMLYEDYLRNFEISTGGSQ
jgi:adenine-specific DNA-methyltransferase